MFTTLKGEIKKYKKFWLLGCLILVLASVCFLKVIFFPDFLQPEQKVEAVSMEMELEEILKDTNNDRLIKLQPKVRNFIDDLGINKVLEKVNDGLIADYYQLNECHRILHIVGHFAYVEGETDFNELTKVSNDICGGSFQHGIEAQIALASSQPLTDLHLFCAALLENAPNGECYHGAGHELMSTKLDVIESLAACDLLQQESPTSNMAPCYQGVFSEYAFQIQGVDGDTGIPFPGGPQIKFEYKNPLDFCASLDLRYQMACSAQLSRLLAEMNSPQVAVHECLSDKYSLLLQSGCIRIVSAVIAQLTFSNDELLTVNNEIIGQPLEVKRAYIAGAAGEYWALRKSGVIKDFSLFCNGLIDQIDITECLSYIK